MTYRLLADDMVALITALDLQKPLIYGYSDGGQVALEIGMRAPDLPQALVVGGAWFKFTPQYRALMQSFFGDELGQAIDTAHFAQAQPDWVAFLQQIYGPDDWKRLIQQVKSMWVTPLNYTSDDFARVVAPTLVLLGDRDNFIPIEEAVEMYRLLPNAELAILPGIDHGDFLSAKVPLIQPLILDFLNRYRETMPPA
jgi:pimeloyl-ACP methyl ester carboxylesterase